MMVAVEDLQLVQDLVRCQGARTRCGERDLCLLVQPS